MGGWEGGAGGGAHSGGLRLHWLEYETVYVHIWITRIMIRL